MLSPLVAAATVWIDVQVYVDRDGDGRRGAGEEGVPGAVIGSGTTEVIADAHGHARLRAQVGWPVWARAFDGFAVPGPWAMVPDDPDPDAAMPPAGAAPIAPIEIDLGLRPQAPPRGPWRFVVASDSHVQRPGEPLGHPSDLANAVAQATAGAEPPRFVIICGDMMQDAEPVEGQVVADAFAVSPSPLIPVQGNHDSYDGGVEWRRRFGPDLYSFEQGGLHVLVLDSMRHVRELVDFARADLATVAPGQRVIAVTHGPPEYELAEALDGLGVELVLAGHWHVNRTLHRGDQLELDTEPWMMGGMDQTPGGYRVVDVEPPPLGASLGEVGGGRASLRVRHYTTTDVPIVSLVGPAPGQCAPTDRPLSLVVALGGGPDLEPVRASVDGNSWVVLHRAGGWDWVGEAAALAPGPHQITLRAGRSKRDVEVDGCAAPPAPAAAATDDADWPQLGGGPGREGARDRALPAHLVPRWVAATGGHLGGGQPIVAGDLVLVSPMDLADDQDSAVVALDLATGALRWRFRPGAAVRNAVAADVATGVVVAAASDGVVWGLDLATGAVRWRVDLGAGVIAEHRQTWGAPLVVGARVFAGNQRRFAAMDLATGKIAWQVDQVPDTDGGGSFASPTLVDGVIVTVPNRALAGVMGWDPDTGAPRFATNDDCTLSAAASPVADGARAHLVSGGATRCIVDVRTGDTRSYGALDRAAFEWAYEVAATPVLARGTLIAVTQFGEAFAFDTAHGDLRWAREVGRPAQIHAAHYRVTIASLAATPVVAGDVAWLGTADGDVIGLDLATGRDRARLHVGAPVLDGLALAGDALVVASYDGTVRVYAGAARPTHAWPIAVDVGVVIALYAGAAALARRRSRPRRRVQSARSA